MTAAYPMPDMTPLPDILPAPPPLDSGWTPDRQVRFLEAIAEGHLVRDACRAVGLTPTAAYSFRRRASGAAFALGWAAANLHARERLADTLLERAVDGQTETITRADGAVIQRHRHDNRLAQAMLARLDRLAAAERPAAPGTARAADAADGPHPAADPAQAARTVATGFESYLDLIGQDAGPARARLFVELAARDGTGCTPALALADRRLHAADPLPDPAPPAEDGPADPDADTDADPAPDAADPAPFQMTTMTTSPTAPPAPAARDHAVLHPADRAGWTATDWARAEAAGLFRFAAPDAPAVTAGIPASPSGPPPIDPARVTELMRTEQGRTVLLADALARYGHGDPPPPAAPEPPAPVEAADAEPDDHPVPVVWRDGENGWRTSFPPPEGFDGWHEFDHGDDQYSRALTWEEEAIAERFEAAEPARLAAAAARDAWFAGGGAPVPAADGAADGATAPHEQDGPAEDRPHAPDADAAARAPDPVPLDRPDRTPATPAEPPLAPPARGAPIPGFRLYQDRYDPPGMQ